MFAVLKDRHHPANTQSGHAFLDTRNITLVLVGGHHCVPERRQVIAVIIRVMQTQKRSGWRQVKLDLFNAGIFLQVIKHWQQLVPQTPTVLLGKCPLNIRLLGDGCCQTQGSVLLVADFILGSLLEILHSLALTALQLLVQSLQHCP